MQIRLDNSIVLFTGQKGGVLFTPDNCIETPYEIGGVQGTSYIFLDGEQTKRVIQRNRICQLRNSTDKTS